MFLPSNKKAFLTIALLALVIAFWGNTLTIFAKAELAKFLIADAWENTLKNKKAHKPWHWADTWPIAKMYFPQKELTFYVLAKSQ